MDRGHKEYSEIHEVIVKLEVMQKDDFVALDYEHWRLKRKKRMFF